MSKRKEKLKGIAKGSKTDQWSQDYSAKGEYMDKQGHMGEDAIYKNERVTVEDTETLVKGPPKKPSLKEPEKKPEKEKPKEVTKSTDDTVVSKDGKKIDEYPTAKVWYEKVLLNKSVNPALKNATAFRFKGKIYSIRGGDPTDAQV